MRIRELKSIQTKDVGGLRLASADISFASIKKQDHRKAFAFGSLEDGEKALFGDDELFAECLFQLRVLRRRFHNNKVNLIKAEAFVGVFLANL